MNADRNQEVHREGTSGPGTQGTAETKRKRKFSDITPSERKLQFIDPTFDDLESHSVGTPVTATTFSKTPRMESTEQTGPRINETGEKDYSFLFTKARFGGSGYGGGGDDNSGGNGNRKSFNKKDPDQPGKQGPSAGRDPDGGDDGDSGDDDDDDDDSLVPTIDGHPFSLGPE